MYVGAGMHNFAVCFVSFPVLVWLLDGATVERPARFLRRLRPAFAVGWWFGFGYFVAGLWWVGGAMLVVLGIVQRRMVRRG